MPLTCLQGFDEYMNLVLDEAEEVSVKRQTRKAVGEQHGPTGLHLWSECARASVHLSSHGHGHGSTEAAVGASVCTDITLRDSPAAAFPRLTILSAAAAGRILLKGDNITLMQTTCVLGTIWLQLDCVSVAKDVLLCTWPP